MHVTPIIIQPRGKSHAKSARKRIPSRWRSVGACRRVAGGTNPLDRLLAHAVWRRLVCPLWPVPDRLRGPLFGSRKASHDGHEELVPISNCWQTVGRHSHARPRSAVKRRFGASTRGDQNPLPEADSQARETGEISRTTVQAGDIAWPQGWPKSSAGTRLNLLPHSELR